MARMATLLLSSILLLLLAGAGAGAGTGSGREECKPAKCNKYGPPVRFPFRLKDHHPDHCAYSPFFHLHCTQNRSDPVIDLPFPVNASLSNTQLPFTIQASVKKIDYKWQTISMSYLQSCLPPHPSVPQNTTANMFRLLLTDYNQAGSTLFNCSSDKAQMLSYPITCLGGAGYRVYAVIGDRKNSARPWSLGSGRVFGRDSVQTESVRPVSLCSCSVRTGFCSAVVTQLGQIVRTGFCSDKICSASVTLLGQSVRRDSARPWSLSSGRVKNALGDVKDQAEDKANPKPWYTVDEKSGKVSTEDLQELLREYPLPEGWYARLPGLQEPANYRTKFETGIYEEQVKSRCRLPLHPFALCFFEHYHMAPGQLVPNGWRKLVGLIYLVQTSGYKPDATDFMRVFFEICFIKGVANFPEWYYIHSRQQLLKGGPKSNRGWHSRYFFVGRLDKGKLPFDRD
ncbi:hypothetical protein RJ639_004875 [Escallonia herrerae]|uniref:RING-type E3 ubiquitin transferase n=1 Tax=Escallonia herrerae TaxID=1293975 RepID=A0AA88W1L6_9ASTE|nr:hypothetical protein RJ639_004875 [Escallonia herrerae]